MKVRLGEMRVSLEAQARVLEDLRHGRTTEGTEIEEFEYVFAKYMNAKYCVATSSGTAALYTIFQSIDNIFKKVLTSPLTYAATVNAPLVCDSRVEFADIELSTLGLDPEKVAEKEYDILLPVHLLGYPCHFNRDKGMIIQDSCEAVGSKLGPVDFASAVSFYPSHTIPVGEMGAILTNDESFAQRCRLVKNNGRNQKDFKNAFVHLYKGLNCKSNDIMAAIAIEQLKTADLVIQRRQEIAKMYADSLPVFLTPSRFTKDCAYLGFPILCASQKQRDRLLEHLGKNDVEARAMFPLITDQPAFKYQFRGEYYPVAELVSHQGLYIPTHQYLTNEQVQFVIRTIKDFKPC